MFEIDSDGHLNNQFTDGDPQAGTPATVISAEFLNAVQAELVNAIEAAGLTLDKNDSTQLLQAIRAVGGGGPLRITLPGDAAAAAGVLSVLAGVVGNIVAIGAKLDAGTSLGVTLTNGGAAVKAFTVTTAFQEITADLDNVATTKGSVLGVDTDTPVGDPSGLKLYVDIQRTA